MLAATLWVRKSDDSFLVSYFFAKRLRPPPHKNAWPTVIGGIIKLRCKSMPKSAESDNPQTPFRTDEASIPVLRLLPIDDMQRHVQQTAIVVVRPPHLHEEYLDLLPGPPATPRQGAQRNGLDAI